MSKYNYFIPENNPSWEAEWLPVAERLKKLLPLKSTSGEVVQLGTEIELIDFSSIADCLTGAPDTTGLTARFLAEVKKKDNYMTVEQLLARPAAEVTRWRKMGNKIALLPNALVLHVNSL